MPHHLEQHVAGTIGTYEKHAEKYATEHSDISEIKKEIDFFLKHLKGRKILDVGCGPGRDAKYFTDRGCDVVGIDVGQNLLTIARRTAPDAKFKNRDLRFLDFPPASFDGLWACASFLHVPKKDAAHTIRGFRKVLKKGGLIYLDVKKGTGEKLVEEWLRDYSRFFAFYEEKELEKLLEANGFKILKVMVEKKKHTWISIYATAA